MNQIKTVRQHAAAIALLLAACGVLAVAAGLPTVNAQVGLRHVSGLAEVDQLVNTGLDEINNDSGRLTLPIVVGVRFRF